MPCSNIAFIRPTTAAIHESGTKRMMTGDWLSYGRIVLPLGLAFLGVARRADLKRNKGYLDVSWIDTAIEDDLTDTSANTMHSEKVACNVLKSGERQRKRRQL